MEFVEPQSTALKMADYIIDITVYTNCTHKIKQKRNHHNRNFDAI